MDPNACIDRIINAIEDADIEEAIDAIDDLTRWLNRGGFAPTNADRLAGLTVAGDLRGRLHDLRLLIAFPTLPRTRAHVQDILNAEDAGEDARLTFVRVDDRGDLGCYVWGRCTVDDAIEDAEEHATDNGWEYDEDDLAAFQVNDEDRAVVLFRSRLLTE
jgi:hypothetical protein